MATWRLDDDFAAVEAKVRRAAEAALLDGGEHILTESNKTVPIEEATLERSGAVSQDGNTVAITYDTRYAAVQHEDMNLRHDEGRRAKWLQLTMQEQAQAVWRFVADRIRGAMR